MGRMTVRRSKASPRPPPRTRERTAAVVYARKKTPTRPRCASATKVGT